MEQIKNQILQAFRREGRLTTADLVRQFGISRQAIHRHLRDLIDGGEIIRQGTSRATTFYIFNSPGVLKRVAGKAKTFKKRVRSAGLSEDSVYNEIKGQVGFLQGISANAGENFHFALTEMLNNAIDHSGSEFVDVEVRIDKNNISFTVRDRGVGVFENICQKKRLKNEMESIQDLLKGKTTTAPEAHSGEGIFFTSKVADLFILESHRKRLTIDNRIEDIFVEDRRYMKGTRVSFETGIGTNKDLATIFKEYTNENFQFDKSMVRVKLFDSGESYISRSQAKRLLHTLDQFGEIVLDFSDVATVGQGFADEVFRIFQSAHPGIKIMAAGCNENVDFMIKRARVSNLI